MEVAARVSSAAEAREDCYKRALCHCLYRLLRHCLYAIAFGSPHSYLHLQVAFHHPHVPIPARAADMHEYYLDTTISPPTSRRTRDTGRVCDALPNNSESPERWEERSRRL